jgi:hypothetical protein
MVEKFAPGVVDIGGKFAAGIADNGGKFATFSLALLIPVANLLHFNDAPPKFSSFHEVYATFQ